MKSQIQDCVSLISRISCGVFAVCTAMCLCDPVRASTISVTAASFSSATIPTTTTDWYITSPQPNYGVGNTKAGGTAISSTTFTNVWAGGNPPFTYSDGTSPLSATGEVSLYVYSYSYDAVPAQIGIDVSAGTGQVLLWASTDSPAQYPASLDTNFATTGESVSTAFSVADGWRQFTIDYSSTAAQTLLLTLTPSYNSQAGFFGVSLTEVPEPSSLALVVSALVGLLAYAWRKRK